MVTKKDIGIVEASSVRGLIFFFKPCLNCSLVSYATSLYWTIFFWSNFCSSICTNYYLKLSIFTRSGPCVITRSSFLASSVEKEQSSASSASFVSTWTLAGVFLAFLTQWPGENAFIFSWYKGVFFGDLFVYYFGNPPVCGGRIRLGCINTF